MKGVRFVDLIDAGDPVQQAKAYEKQGADELVFLDITASNEERKIMLDVVERTASECFMPLTVGGGLRNLEDIRTMLNAGADKVSLNTSALLNPKLISDASNKFGNQCIVVAVDAKKGTVLGLCTNKPAAPTQIVLDQFGLASFFSAVVGGDRLPTRKPDPAMLHLVMQELAVDHCLFVGDSEVDVATAKAAGMPVALFTKGYRQTPVAELAPEFHFDDYRVLPAIAERCFSGFNNR